MLTDNIFFEQEVPYYIPCMYPLVHEYLRNYKINSYISIHPNIEMLGLPSFYKNEEMSIFKVNISAYNAKRLGYKSRGEYLGFDLYRRESENQEEGLELLKSMIVSNNSAIVSGSQYYLPYCNNYRNDNYVKNYPNPLFGVVNHWVSVYRIEEDEVLLRDTTFNHLGTILIKDFLDFWKGDKLIESLRVYPGVSELLENGYIDIKVNCNLSVMEYHELFMETIKTIAYEYLNGRNIKEGNGEHFFGKAALGELHNSINSTTLAETEKGIFESLSTCLYNLRFNRFIFRDLLSEINIIFQRQYQELIIEFSEIISKLEDVSYIYAVNLKRNKMNFDTIQKILIKFKGYIDTESAFFEKVYEQFKDYTLLERAI